MYHPKNDASQANTNYLGYEKKLVSQWVEHAS